MSSVSQDKRPLQLPNCVREAFLGLEAPKTAILLDLLFTLGYKPGQWVTYQEVLNVAGQHTANHICREGLLHWTIKREQLPQDRPGRPTFKYRLPSIDELRGQIVVEQSFVTDILTLEDFRNAKSYRMALHRELIRRGYEDNDHMPKVFGRELMSKRLNVSPDTLRSYERELGTYVEERWHVQPIRYDFEVHLLPKKRVHDGRVLKIVAGGETIRYMPCVGDIAGLYRKQGYEVSICKRQCNAYAPYSPYSEQGRRDRHGEWADIINF